jgi:serine/threonine protein phosphatase 1
MGSIPSGTTKHEVQMKNLKGIQYFDINYAGTDYIVGDLHGCHTKLMEALRIAEFDFDKDRLFCVGDLIDRGPESLECLQLLLEPWFFSAMGNHELMMVSHDISPWYRNGGDWWARIDKDFRKFLIALVFDKCPIAMEIEQPDFIVGIVHSEVPTAQWGINNWTRYLTVEQALWDRNRIKYGKDHHFIKGIDLVVHGHTPTRKVVHKANEAWIDLGAVYKDENPVVVFTMEELYNENQDIQRSAHRVSQGSEEHVASSGAAQ